MSNLVSATSFSAKLLSIWVGPSMYWWMGLFLPRYRTHNFLLNLMKFLSAHFSSLLRSLWMTSWCSDMSPHVKSHEFCVICRLSEDILCPIIQMMMWNRTGPGIDSWSIPLVSSLQLDCATDQPSLDPTIQTVFSPPHCLLILPIYQQLVYKAFMGECQKPHWSPIRQYALFFLQHVPDQSLCRRIGQIGQAWLPRVK